MTDEPGSPTLAGKLRRKGSFAPIGPNRLGICTVRWEPRDAAGRPLGDPQQIDDLNRRLQELIEHEGDAWFSHTVLKGRVALRFNVENRLMEQADIDRLVEVLARGTERILAQRDTTTGGERREKP